MATKDYWAEPPVDRCQSPFTRLHPTLDSMIGDDDPVRIVDEVLAEVDWSDWESHYVRRRGQPPIHPKCITAGILYGMFRGIRSSRRLEEACNYRWDFMWLVESRRIDHTTFSKFRTRFGEELKDLFRRIGRIAMTLGLIRLGEVAFDGTRVKANNSRFQTRTAKTLEEKLHALDKLFDELMTQLNAADDAEAGQGSPTHLPEELADVQQRRQQVKEALRTVRAMDEARRRDDGIDPQKKPAQIPITDSDSRVMPNKEGGHAPNYTPVASTDGERGFIVDCDVLPEVNEGPAAVASVDRIEETFGRRPEKFLTDAGNNSGQNMEAMEQRGVEFFTPVQSPQPEPDSPVLRDDLTQPVPESEHDQLKRNSKKKLDKSCFVFVAEEDQYYCPQGRALAYQQTKTEKRRKQIIQRRVYRCADCTGCPLAAACLGAKNQRGRTVTRDQYEAIRARTAARMATPAAREIYRQRSWIAETPFAIFKQVMGLRQFLLRGLEKVRIEWRWAATAFNLAKLVRELAKMRAELSQLALEG